MWGTNIVDAALQLIVGHLMQLAEELKNEAGETLQIRDNVSDLIEELDEATLHRLVDMGGDFGQRARFVLDASKSLAPSAVMKVLHVSAASSQQTVSDYLMGILNKLGVHANGPDTPLRAAADDAFQENVEELMVEWHSTDANRAAHTALLDEMAQAAPILAGDPADPGRKGSLPGAARIVMMALEVDTYGPLVEKAIVDLLEQGSTRFLVTTIQLAEGTGTAARIKQALAEPEHLDRILTAEKIDVESVRTIVTWMGPAAIELLLETLAESESQVRRELALESLQDFGPLIWDGILRHLMDSRGVVIRNMLLLVQALDHRHPDFDATRFITNADPEVRRLAFSLAMQNDARTEIITSALADDDDDIVRMGLVELKEAVPSTVVPVLVNSVVLGGGSPEIRALGIRTAGPTRSSIVLEALLSLTTVKETLLGGAVLAPKSMEMLAAVATLARFWPDETRAAKILKAARRSRDPEIKATGDTS